MKAILGTGLKAVASAVVFDWYWIDDKVCFQAALFFSGFSSHSPKTGDKQGAPVITVPVG
jgi:hypothetical protein